MKRLNRCVVFGWEEILNATKHPFKKKEKFQRREQPQNQFIMWKTVKYHREMINCRQSKNSNEDWSRESRAETIAKIELKAKADEKQEPLKKSSVKSFMKRLKTLTNPSIIKTSFLVLSFFFSFCFCLVYIHFFFLTFLLLPVSLQQTTSLWVCVPTKNSMWRFSVHSTPKIFSKLCKSKRISFIQIQIGITMKLLPIHWEFWKIFFFCMIVCHVYHICCKQLMKVL